MVSILFLCHEDSQFAGHWKRESSYFKNIEWNFASSVNQYEELMTSKSGSIDEASYNERIEVVVFHRFSTSADLLDNIVPHLPHLKWVHLCTAGVDSFLSVLSKLPKSVITSNAKGAYSKDLAEFAMACILHFEKSIPKLQENKRNRLWDQFVTSSLDTKTLGLLGYGSIGKAIARLAKVFNMKIIALRKNLTEDKDSLIDEIYSISDAGKMTIFKEADYIVNVLPLTSQTYHFCGKDEFSTMKKSSVFINLGRGQTVDEVEMIKVLKEKRIHGAALDVFEEEPLPQDNDLWNLQNVLISPHCADMTPNMDSSSFQIFLENLKMYLAGGKLLTGFDIENEY